jgi:hypothetical protein
MKKRSLSPKARRVLNRMTEEEWKDLTNRLLYFTYRNYGANLKRLAFPVDELVQDAIGDLLTGARMWPPVDSFGNEKEVSLFVFLCNTIRSKVSHLFQKSKRQTYVGDRSELDLLSPLLLSEGVERAAEGRVEYGELSKLLIERVSDDAVLTQMVMLWIETPDLRPREVALILGLSMDEFRNAQKRLIRRVKTLREEKLK